MNQDLIEKYGVKKEGPVKCPRFKEGDEFISIVGRIPEGFCSWELADIHDDVSVLNLGGNFSWVKEKGVGITGCTNGFTPVIFKIERN